MNPQDTDPLQPEDTGAPAAETAPKPRRRRTTSKVAAPESAAAESTAPDAATEAAVAAPAADLPPVEAAEAAPAKPKRTRRKTVASADAEAPAEAAAPTAAPDVVAVAPAVAEPMPTTSIAPVAPTPASVIAAGEPVTPTRPAAAEAESAEGSGGAGLAGGAEGAAAGGEAGDGRESAEGAESAESAEEGEAGDGQRRRNRRRRGRRGGADRAVAEGAPAAEPVVAAGGDDEADDEDDEDDEPAAAPAAPLPPVDAGETFADVLSGAYDALPSEDIEAIPERRVLAAEPDAPKLHKVLAQAGVGSRRDMEQLIVEGRVTVNGQPAHVGQRISFGDQIKVAGKPVKVRIVPPLPRVIAYHKPVGEVVTHDDPERRPTVFRRLPRLPQGKWQSVGRLDINTEGLLLFTNSGELANQLMHPRFGVEREYAVRVLGTLDEDSRESLLEGVEIDGQRAAFKSIADGGGEGANHWYRVVISEGRNREVRKLFDSVDLTVSRLIRIRYGCVVLPRGLKRGVWVDLNEAEVRELRRLSGARDGGQPQASQGPRQNDGGGKARRNRRGRGGDRNDRNDRGDRGDRGDRVDRGVDRGDRFERREPGEGGPIPNPLQQTFDKRAIKEARQPRREYSEDGPIPNPLEQTYDKRFVQKQRGFGGGGGGGRNKQGGDGGGQPDPMKTSVGYIGADAFVRKFQQQGGGRGGKRRGGR